MDLVFPIAFDIDGVVVNMAAEIRKHILEKTGHDIEAQPITKFDIQVPGLSYEATGDLVWEAVQLYSAKARPFPLAVEGLISLKTLYRLCGIQDRILFITSRRQDIAGIETHEWLTRYLGKDAYDVWFVRSWKRLKSFKNWVSGISWKTAIERFIKWRPWWIMFSW